VSETEPTHSRDRGTSRVGEDTMQTYEELIELARMCAKNAHIATMKEVARELWKMANEYRAKAMALDTSKPINIGEPPSGERR